MANQLIALLQGDHALAEQVISEMSTTPVTTLVTLLLKEEKKQTPENRGQDNVVYDNQCKR
jgi:hypothetical protein